MEAVALKGILIVSSLLRIGPEAQGLEPLQSYQVLRAVTGSSLW